jgi:RimJ/RimL family protein N-acetyltransferase
MSLIFGQGVIDWVDSKIENNPGFDSPIGIGILKDGHITCGVVFDNWRPTVKTVFASIAIEDKAALTRDVLRQFFEYAFNHLDCNRITCLIEINNISSIKLCGKLGFVNEGQLRQASITGTDVIIFGMLKSDCSWL